MQAELDVARELRRIGDEFNQLYCHEVRNACSRACVCAFYNKLFGQICLGNVFIYSVQVLVLVIYSY